MLPAAISGLLSTGCPTAILWLVIAVWIGIAIKACVQWTRPHVFKEEHKIIPSLAKLDASAAVPFPGVMLAIATAFACGTPAFVCAIFRSRLSELLMMPWFSLARCSVREHRFAQKTAATARRPMTFLGAGSPQITARHDGQIAAVAATFPLRVLRNDWKMTTQYNQAAYAFPG